MIQKYWNRTTVLLLWLLFLPLSLGQDEAGLAAVCTSSGYVWSNESKRCYAVIQDLGGTLNLDSWGAMCQNNKPAVFSPIAGVKSYIATIHKPGDYPLITANAKFQAALPGLAFGLWVDGTTPMYSILTDIIAFTFTDNYCFGFKTPGNPISPITDQHCGVIVDATTWTTKDCYSTMAPYALCEYTFSPVNVRRTSTEDNEHEEEGKDETTGAWGVLAKCKFINTGIVGIGDEAFSVDQESETATEIDEEEVEPVLDVELEAKKRNQFQRIFNPDSGEYEGDGTLLGAAKEIQGASIFQLDDDALLGIEDEDLDVESESTESDEATTPDGEPKTRRKRSTTAKRHLQLGVYVDEGLWLRFVKVYGEKDAEEAIHEYVDFVVDTAEILWSLDSISPNLAIHTPQPVTIWKTQPKGMPNERHGDISEYLDAASALLAPGQESSVDHATVWTGLRLKFYRPSGKKAVVNGVARRGGICEDEGVSVLNVRPKWTKAGYTFAHELGHNMGMCHDGDLNCPFAAPCGGDEIHIMTREGTAHGSNSLQWSSCSSIQLQQHLRELEDAGKNCLSDKVSPEPIDLESYPGQRRPPEAQCESLGGACARHTPDKQGGNCRRLVCTFNNEFDRPATFDSTYLLEGAYCGAGKICLSGECQKIDGSLGKLKRVDGGWGSSWRQDDSRYCGKSNCTACLAKGQLPLQREFRSCDQPYPSNGGKPCPGINIRGRVCPGKESCKSGAELANWRLKSGFVMGLLLVRV